MEELKKILKEKRITQKEFAEMIGITPAALNNYVQGKTEPNISLIKKMANELQVSIDYLLGNEKRTSSTTSPTKQRALDIFNQLADNDYLVLIGYMEHLLLEKEQKRKQRINTIIEDINRGE